MNLLGCRVAHAGQIHAAAAGGPIGPCSREPVRLTRCRPQQPCGSWCYQQSFPHRGGGHQPPLPERSCYTAQPVPVNHRPGGWRQLASATAEACNRSQASQAFAFLAGRRTSGEWSGSAKPIVCGGRRGRRPRRTGRELDNQEQGKATDCCAVAA